MQLTVFFMDRIEKLRLSADAEWCHCFKHGMFARLYEQSLYWFSHAVKPLKPMLERVKGGDVVVYGGLPISSLEALIEQGALQQAESTEYGWKWPYAEQMAMPEGTPAFTAWREAALVVPTLENTGTKTNMRGNRDILAEIAAFNLAAHTPIQAMCAIQAWQEALQS